MVLIGFKRALFALSCLLSLSHAATITINSTENAVVKITTAKDGDTVVFSGGEHALAGTIIVDKSLTIRGFDGSTILRAPMTVDSVFEVTNQSAKVTFQSMKFKHRSVNQLCNLATPLALQANFSLNINSATIRQNLLNLDIDTGYWFSTRYVSNVWFAGCNYLADGPVGSPNGANKMLNYKMQMKADTCRASILFSVKFDMLGNCNTTIAKTGNYAVYTADIEANMVEYVNTTNGTNTLSLATDRYGNARARLRVMVNRVGTVSATIAVNYPSQEFEAVISKLGVKEIDGVNTSKIIITVNMPGPYTIATGAVGSLNMTDMSIPGANSSDWVSGTACNNVAVNATCNNTITFNVTTCDLTGVFRMLDVPITCQESSIANGGCPKILAPYANITVFISTNDFCKISEVNLSSIFTLDIKLRSDNNYLASRPTNQFLLGETAYWSLRLWTNSTGVGIADAKIVDLVRESNQDCTNFPQPFADTTTIVQSFKGLLTPPEIQNPMLLTVPVSCATAAGGATNITLTWTVLVDYIDTTFRRRRRSVQKSESSDSGYGSHSVYDRVRRDSGELTGSDAFGVKVKPGEVQKVAGTEATASSGGRNNTLIAIIAVVVGLCCCCCIVGGGGVVAFRRYKNNEEMKEKAMSLASGSQPMFTTSTMNFDTNGQKTGYNQSMGGIGSISSSSAFELSRGNPGMQQQAGAFGNQGGYYPQGRV